MSAYNPVLPDTLPIDITVNLVSSLSGVLDTIHFTTQFQLMQKRILVNLTEGDNLSFEVSQREPSEMAINSQAVTIVKLS